MRRLLLVLAALMLAATAAHADFYTWTDKDGKVFYTNEKEKIPEAYRASAKPVEVREDRVSVGRNPAGGVTSTVRFAPHKDKQGRGEDYWRKRADKLRKQLRQEQNERDALSLQLEEHERAAAAGQKVKKGTGSSLKKKIAQLDKKITATKRELEVELPEEARKADAYPGWLRE